ncbi:MAG: hypothetical protein CVU40_12705 [Chloroflexi bacterium HGW-Chloroflexi-2]|jgi:hypothetical protein|nr:MAG: hypothetical protein CVU40_12705 [Chloroflexi bacterium HGW-Chloroflexi-2]
MKGGLGRAVVGGVLSGGIGAIVGASTRGSSDIVKSLTIRIITNNSFDSLRLIPLIKSNTKRDSSNYKNCMSAAQGIYSSIISILNSGKTANQNNLVDSDKTDVENSVVGIKNSESLSDQIRELAKLKEEGLISEEEFAKKKKAILNID